jgi:hypothetical protein
VAAAAAAAAAFFLPALGVKEIVVAVVVAIVVAAAGAAAVVVDREEEGVRAVGHIGLVAISATAFGRTNERSDFVLALNSKVGLELLPSS